MQKQMQNMKKKPVKEETNKAKIVKDVLKKKKNSDNTFQDEPVLGNTITKNY
jgi:hypothetical protein